MARSSIVIPNTFATAPASPATVPAVQLDQDFNALLGGFTDSSNGYVNAAADTGIANAYVVTLSPAPTGYANGMAVAFVPANSNTAASTLNVNSLGTIPILNPGGNAVGAGQLMATSLVLVIYYNGNFYMFGQPTEQSFTQTPLAAGTITINCANLSRVAITINATGAPNTATTFTINVTNVVYGCHFDVIILTPGINPTFKWSGTDQLGNALTAATAYYPNGINQAAVVDLIATGDSAGSVLLYQGFSRNTTTSNSALKFIAAYHN